MNIDYGTWNNILSKECNKAYYKDLMSFLEKEYKDKTIYPNKEDIGNAFKKTKLSDVKCVIIGQDPYHKAGQAMGLSFSVNDGIKLPKSLRNIYKELNNEYGYDIPNTGNLTSWAEQGVLLLNTILTVEEHEPNSHKKSGWKNFTDEVIKIINKENRPIVFILWGNNAKEKINLLNNPKHLILSCPHPSPYSAKTGFFGCNHFKMCNDFLKNNGVEPINWEIKQT